MTTSSILRSIQQLILRVTTTQPGEFYSIESALKKPRRVKTLYLNFNFTAITELPKEIGKLQNLEELIFFHRLFQFPKVEGKVVIQKTIDDNELRSVDSIPDEISNCKKLRIMDFTFSSLKKLPPHLNQFPNLELIRLTSTPIDLDCEINNLLSIENQLTLEILDCKISEENLNRLKNKKNLNILAKRVDLENSTNETKHNSVDVQLHDTFWVFASKKEANRFINSMPSFYKQEAIIYGG